MRNLSVAGTDLLDIPLDDRYELFPALAMIDLKVHKEFFFDPSVQRFVDRIVSRTMYCRRSRYYRRNNDHIEEKKGRKRVAAHAEMEDAAEKTP